MICDILQRLQAGEKLAEYPARLRCKDGSIKDVLIDSSVLWRGRRVRPHPLLHQGRHRAEAGRGGPGAAGGHRRVVRRRHRQQDARRRHPLAGTPGPSGSSATPPQEAVGRPITLIIPPERQDEEQAILERLRRGERVEHFETVRVAKDGRRLDISLTISPVRDGEGRIIGASKIARDITERKRAEEERQRLLEEVAGRAATAGRRSSSRAPSFTGHPPGAGARVRARQRPLLRARRAPRRHRQAGPRSPAGGRGPGLLRAAGRRVPDRRGVRRHGLRVLVQRHRPADWRSGSSIRVPAPPGRRRAVSGILAQGIDLTERKRAEAAVRASATSGSGSVRRERHRLRRHHRPDPTRSPGRRGGPGRSPAGRPRDARPAGERHFTPRGPRRRSCAEVGDGRPLDRARRDEPARRVSSDAVGVSRATAS